MSASLINPIILFARNLLLRHRPIKWLIWANVAEWKTFHKLKWDQLISSQDIWYEITAKSYLRTIKTIPSISTVFSVKAPQNSVSFEGQMTSFRFAVVLTWVCFPGFTGTVCVNNYSRRVNKDICNLVPAGNLFLKPVHSLCKAQILYFILFCI